MFSFFRNKRIAKIEKRLGELEREVIQLRERTQLAINALQEDYELMKCKEKDEAIAVTIAPKIEMSDDVTDQMPLLRRQLGQSKRLNKGSLA